MSKQSLRQTKLLGVILLLAFFWVLPTPVSGMSVAVWSALLALWVSTIFLAYGFWYWPKKWIWILGLQLVVCLYWALVIKKPGPLLMMSLWGSWAFLRMRRLGWVLSLFLCSWGLQAQSKDIIYRGMTLNQAGSCLSIDKVPWVFRKTERQSRLLIRDKMRLSTQSEYSSWEIHQVKDKNGYISYIFRRPLPNGSFESIVTKENHYNRIIDTAKSRKIVEVRNLMTFIDRAALSFSTEDGNTVVFKPGLGGKASLILSYANGGQAPVYLKGSACERYDMFSGEDPYATENKSGSSSAPSSSAPSGAAK